ncbi:MAG: Hsp20/alpha crystallin family protein [Bacteroidota bacterium]
MLMRLYTRPLFATPLRSLLDPERSVDSLCGPVPPSEGPVVHIPPVEVFSDEEGTVITAELPGVQRESLKISLLGDVLTVSGEHVRPELPEGGSWLRTEACYGAFSRSLELPHPVNEKDVTAELSGGVLRIQLPKADEARPRTIEVREAKGASA